MYPRKEKAVPSYFWDFRCYSSPVTLSIFSLLHSAVLKTTWQFKKLFLQLMRGEEDDLINETKCLGFWDYWVMNMKMKAFVVQLLSGAFSLCQEVYKYTVWHVNQIVQFWTLMAPNPMLTLVMLWKKDDVVQMRQLMLSSSHLQSGCSSNVPNCVVCKSVRPKLLSEYHSPHTNSPSLHCWLKGFLIARTVYVQLLSAPLLSNPTVHLLYLLSSFVLNFFWQFYSTYLDTIQQYHVG